MTQERLTPNDSTRPAFSRKLNSHPPYFDLGPLILSSLHLYQKLNPMSQPVGAGFENDEVTKCDYLMCKPTKFGSVKKSLHFWWCGGLL
jgi:hypothetical protein